jgi:hypothetical protein
VVIHVRVFHFLGEEDGKLGDLPSQKRSKFCNSNVTS